jgi:predicted RecB family nuclease
MNINRALDKTWESKSLREILDAPVAALEGVSESDAAKLQEAFGIKTISDLADCKYFHWAVAIKTLAAREE